MTVGNTGNNSTVNLGRTGTETSLSQLATHIHFRKIWSHGDWAGTGASGLVNGLNSTTDSFAMNCVYCSLVDSQASQNLRPGGEGHTIGTGFGTQFKFNHNWLEGQSIGSFSGGFAGGSGPSIPGLVPFQDVEMRRNRFTFPYDWIGLLKVPATNAHWGGQNIDRKNTDEMKEGERVIKVGNIFENSDNGGGQSGPTFDVDVRNNSGSVGSNYQATINDVTIAYNIARNSCHNFETSRGGSGSSAGNGITQSQRNLWFHDNLFYNVNSNNPGCTTATSLGVSMTSSDFRWQGTITENAAGTEATFVATCSVDNGDCPLGPPGVGFQVLDILPGDPVAVWGCTAVTAFNVPTANFSGNTWPSGVGPFAVAGTNPNSLTVTYPWVATPNAVDASGNCFLSIGQGGGRNTLYTHNTAIQESVHAFSSTNTPAGNGPHYQINGLVRDNITLSGGWFNSSRTEGTSTETFDYDITSLTADHNVWPTRTASNYTEYGNNTAFAAGPCTTPTGCNPPLSMYFPATDYCTGATSTSACVGFIGAMSLPSGPMPLTLNDYHNFALRSDSLFFAGNSQQASDGKSMGADISAIDNAETTTTYTCPYTCGSPGPFVDH